MRKSKVYCLLILLSIFTSSATLVAGNKTAKQDENNFYATPIQIALFAPIQLAPVDSDVYGLKLSLPYGVNRTLYGLDLGLCNSDQEVYGLNVAGWTIVKGNQYGIMLGGLLSSRGNSDSKSYGLNIAGGVNLSKGTVYGVSIGGLVNYAADAMTGLQVACWSSAKKLTGLQIGVVNYAGDLTGIQLGLVNICPKGYLPFMIIINGKF